MTRREGVGRKERDVADSRRGSARSSEVQGAGLGVRGKEMVPPSLVVSRLGPSPRLGKWTRV